MCVIIVGKTIYCQLLWASNIKLKSIYAINDLKTCVGMKEVSIKDVQFSLQKIITWTQKSGKGLQEWVKTCKDVVLWPQKLKTLVKTKFASKVILFKQCLEFKDTINLYYSQQAITLQSKILNPQMCVKQINCTLTFSSHIICL